MNNLEKFNETVSILVKAYLNDTLQHCNCHACAVGNLVADKMGIKLIRRKDGDIVWQRSNPAWFNPIWFGGISEEKVTPTIQKQYDSTGYTGLQLAKIEFAFEDAKGNTRDDFDPEWMFNGLMAVVDVLAEIHNIDLSVKEQAKLLFVK